MVGQLAQFYNPAANFNAVPYGGVPNYFGNPAMTNQLGAAQGQGSLYGLRGFPTAQMPYPQMGGSNVMNQMFQGATTNPLGSMFGYMPAADSQWMRTIMGIASPSMPQPLAMGENAGSSSLPAFGLNPYAVMHFFNRSRASNFPSQPSYGFNPMIPSYLG